jgi:hypothetical protein
MANPKQKQRPETTRKPGRSRFTIPRKESPQIDSSYLDHLFADLQQSAPEATLPSALHVVPSGPIVSPLETSRTDLSGQFISQPPGDIERFPSPPATSTTTSVGKKVSREQKKNTFPKKKFSARNETSSPTLHSDEQFSQLARQFRLSKGEISILQIMLNLCRERDSDTCYVKIPQLSEAAQISHRQSQRILFRLQETGFLEKIADYSNVDKLGAFFRLTLS